MPKTRISVRVDRALLDEYREAAGDQADLSELMAESLRIEIRRFGMLALLDEWEREDPISAEDRAAGDRLWKEIESSSTPARSRRSPKKVARSAQRSIKSS